METNQLQQELFHYLKENLPPHLSLPDELCKLLNLSSDSVYRRLRGEKPITLNELKKICDHYQLSLDQLLQLKNETVLFLAPGMNGMNEGLTGYLKGMLKQFYYFNSFKIRELQYLCKDVTFWDFYLYPELAAFKSFFWSKNIHNDPSLAHKKFSLEEYLYPECFALGQQILQEYNKIPSIEIWNLESIHSTINQVAYYKEAGIFKTKDDINIVIDSIHKMLDHIEMQAEKGVKFMPGAGEAAHRAPIEFYVNELILGNNTILLSLDDKKISIITHSVLSYLVTSDGRFAEKAFTTIKALSSRSTLISKTGEKDRNRFFNTLHDKVNVLKN